jgi:seryl-tRNA synthetase
MSNDPRIEEILKALEIIKTKLPNGELEVIKRSIQSLSEDQKSIKEDLEYFKKRLFNPDDGVIVRINKNTDAIMRNEELVEEIPQLKNRLENMEKWQNGVNKALWFVFTTIAGIIIALIMGTITKN